MDNKNILLNHTLEEYKKKYRNREHRLLKITKKEVEEFDKKYSTYTKGYLLKDRKWWLIGDAYYEIPKAPRYTWFRNLNAACQVGTCILGAGVIATAVIVPTVMAINRNAATRDVEIASGVEHIKNCSIKESGNNYEISFTVEDGYEVTGIEKITINGQEFTDYKFENGKVIISKEALDKHTGKIVVTPKIGKVLPTYDSIEVVSLPTKWIYIVGEKFSSTGLKVAGVKGTDKTDITTQCSLSVEEGHEFTDIEEEKEIKVTYNGKETSFNIAINDTYDKYLEFENEANGVIKKKTGATLPKYLSIPEKLNDKDVKKIASHGFSEDDKIKVLDLSNSKVTSLRSYAFSGCLELKKIIIGSEVDFIGGSASGASTFDGCSSLEEIVFLNSKKIDFNYVESSGDGNFDGCNSLKTITIESKEFADIKQTDGNYFDPTLYINLETVYIKSGIELSTDSFIYKFSNKVNSDRDGYDKYEMLEYLYERIDGTDNCKILGTLGAFKGGDVVLPSKIKGLTVTVIGEAAFSGDTTINSVKFNDELIKFEGDAPFENCSNLKKVHINSGFTKFGGSGDFSGTALEEIIIDSKDVAEGANGTLIGSYLLEYTNAVIKIKDGITSSVSTEITNRFTDITPAAETGDGYDHYETAKFKYEIISAVDKTCKITVTTEYFQGGDVVLPSKIKGLTVTEIGDWAFADDESINSIKFNEELKKTGDGPFDGCKNLKKVHINSGFTEFGGSADFYDTALEEIIIDSKDVAEDTAGTLDGSYLLEYTNAVIKIKDGITTNVSKLITEKFTKFTPASKTGDGYDHYEVNHFDYTVISESEKTCKIKASKSFSLKDVVLPDEIDGYTVTETEEDSFRGEIAKIKSVSLPTHLTKIGTSSFKNQSDITSVVFNDELKVMGNSAFESTGLTGKITLNNGLTDIGVSAFSSCTKLSEINIPSTVTSIESTAFAGCTSMNSVTIDSKYAACLNNSDTELFASGRSIKVLTSITTEYKEDFEKGYIFTNKDGEGVVEGNYTVFKIK